jgi:hypothetical protein
MVTRDDGRFVFRDLPAGRYRLVATRTGTGFVPVEYGQRDPRGKGVPIVLSAGQRLENLELEMVPTGSISGRIFDGDGEPVGNARVMALEAHYHNGQRTLSVVQAVRSNDLGEYRLFWLHPGRYYIAVKREDQRNFSVSTYVAAPEAAGFREDASSPIVTQRTLEDGRTIEETDVVVYYGGGTDAQTAQAVNLDAGAALSAVDVPIGAGKVRTYRVKGTLSNAPIDPKSLSQVRLIPRKRTAHAMIPNAIPDKEGAFTLTGVIPGSYYLAAIVGGGRGFSFSQSYWEFNDGIGGLAPIEVGEADLENVSLTLKPAFTMPGRIRIEGGGNQNRFDITSVRVSLIRDPDLLGLPAPSNRTLKPSQLPSGVPSADGIFTLSGFGAGSYRVTMDGIPPTAYVKAIHYGATDVLAAGLNIENPPDTQLEVVVALDGGLLEGTTRNEKLEPVLNATIVLVPDAPLRTMHHLYKAEYSDTTGRFVIQGIAPGDYKVFAFDSIDSGAWLDPDVLQSYETRGTPVRLGAGGSRQMQLTVLPRAR